MRKKFCCDASRGMYEEYYTNQSGDGVPVYQGSPGQRGHGLGSMLSGFFRSAMPMIRRGLAYFGRQALKTGLEVANDVVEGQSASDSAKRRIPEGLRRFVSTVNLSGDQSGHGYGIKRRSRSMSAINDRGSDKRARIVKFTRKNKKTKRRDIFS